MKKILSIFFLALLVFFVFVKKNKTVTELNAKTKSGNIKLDSIVYDALIPDPLKLEYEVSNDNVSDAVMSDGQSVLLYIAKNNKPNSDGDYGWSKSVPLDKDYHAKVAYEYQLDFNKKSFDNLKAWLKRTLGEENVFGVAFDFKNAEKGLYDTPASWYNNDMSLTDVYNYCKNTNDSTIMIWGRRDLQSQLISIIFNPDVNEMTILYTFLNN